MIITIIVCLMITFGFFIKTHVSRISYIIFFAPLLYWIPVFDPLITLFIISSFRKMVFGFFKLKKVNALNTVTSTNNAKLNWQKKTLPVIKIINLSVLIKHPL